MNEIWIGSQMPLERKIFNSFSHVSLKHLFRPCGLCVYTFTQPLFFINISPLSLQPSSLPSPYLPLFPIIIFLCHNATSSSTTAIPLDSRSSNWCTWCMLSLGPSISETIPEILLALINRYIPRRTTSTTFNKTIESICGVFGSRLRISGNLSSGKLRLFGYVGFRDLGRKVVSWCSLCGH